MNVSAVGDDRNRAHVHLTAQGGSEARVVALRCTREPGGASAGGAAARRTEPSTHDGTCRAVSTAIARSTSSGGQHRDHADAHVERLLHLVALDPAARGD